MKITGLLLTGTSFILFAYTKLRLYKHRIEALQTATEFLRLLQIELCSHSAPMQEVFCSAASKASDRQRRIFQKLSEDMDGLGEKSFYDIWTGNVLQAFSHLAEDESRVLVRLGMELGLCPVDMQISALANCESTILEKLAREKSEYPQLRKLYICLAVTSAAAFIIVFI